MSRASNITLPKTYSGDTWDGLTWAVSDAAGDTEYAGALTLVRFQLQDSGGAAVLTLTSADPAAVTLNSAAPYAWSATVEPRILTLPPGDYTFGMEFTDDSTTPARVKTRLAGTLEILPDPCA